MSVGYISSEAIEQATTDGSISLTIPATCDYITVCATGFNSSVSSEPFAFFDQMDFDDTPSAMVLTEIDNQRFNSANPDATVNTYGITATDGNWPGTGSQTFYYDIVPTANEGLQILVSYWKDVDQTTPIIDTDASDRVSAFTSSLTGMGAGDMGVICAYRYGTAPDMNPGSVGQTVILEQAAFNDACFGFAYELAESALEASGSNLVPVAFGIAAATGASTLTADSGSYTFTGSAVSLERGLTLSADSGGYSYSGTGSDLSKGSVLALGSGSYTYSGTNTDLLKGLSLGADSGAYTYSGTAAMLTFTGAGSFELAAESGAYTYSGSEGSLLADRNLAADSGAYSYTGTAATLSHNMFLVADSGAYSYSGANAALTASLTLSVDSGEYAYAGTSAVMAVSGQVVFGVTMYPLIESREMILQSEKRSMIINARQ